MSSLSSSHNSISYIVDDHHDMNIISRSLQEGDDVNNTNLTSCTLECCHQFEEEICGEEEISWSAKLPFVVQIILIALLLCMSALFSGLTLGLMSLDKTGLEIVMAGDDPVDAEYAKRIYPVRSNGNLLLCTLLLGNVAVNSLLSIILADFAGGTVGFVISTFLIVIFGEILPQAFVSFVQYFSILFYDVIIIDMCQKRCVILTHSHVTHTPTHSTVLSICLTDR